MNKIKKILIIDDDSIFVFVIKKIVSKINNRDEVINIKNGFDALDFLTKIAVEKKQFPDFIFLDLNMPMLDGWQFLEEIELLSFKNELNIYIVSSTIDEREIEKSKGYKTVKQFVPKPITQDDLATILNKE